MAANVPKQAKLPFSDPEVETTIEKREKDLANFADTFNSVKAEARSIGEILTRDSTGAYPAGDNRDPTSNAARRRSYDLVAEYESIIRLTNKTSATVKGLKAAAERKKHRINKIFY